MNTFADMAYEAVESEPESGMCTPEVDVAEKVGEGTIVLSPPIALWAMATEKSWADNLDSDTDLLAPLGHTGGDLGPDSDAEKTEQKSDEGEHTEEHEMPTTKRASTLAAMPKTLQSLTLPQAMCHQGR